MLTNTGQPFDQNRYIQDVFQQIFQTESESPLLYHQNSNIKEISPQTLVMFKDLIH